MNFLAGLNAQIGKLVHPAMRSSSLTLNHHRDFLGTRLAVSLGAMVAAPLCLALGGAPAWWEAGALVWLMLPIVAVALVSRTGDLARGEALSLAAWLGLALTLAGAGGSAASLGLLLIVPFEAALTLVPLTGSAMAAIAAAAGAAVLMPLAALATGPVADPFVTRFAAAINAAAVLYAVVLATLSSRLRVRRRDDEQKGRDRYRELCASIEEVPLRLDRSGWVIEAGTASQRLFGIAHRDLLGRGLFEQVHVADRPGFLKLVADAAAGAPGGSVVVKLRKGETLPSGKGAFREPVFAWAELRMGAGGPPGGRAPSPLLVLMRDVTARRQAEAAFEAAEQATRRSETGRTLFLANVSHELRTPLNAIIGFADMLASEDHGPRDPAKQREYAGIIRQSGHHLLAMVNTILDASKIEAGSFTIAPEPFDLARLIDMCCDMVGLKAGSCGIELTREVASPMTEVIGDERAYKQILLNLLSNALKFTPAGGRVSLSARPEGTSVILAVADTGVGISGGDLPKLGAPFFQAQNTYDRAYDGTGLGLSVVRGLVGLHGGSMMIESAPGQGTRVAIRLPADCRPHMRDCANDTRIETIPRYVQSMPQPVGRGDFGRITKVA